MVYLEVEGWKEAERGEAGRGGGVRRMVQGRGQEAWPASAQRPLTFTSQEGEQVGFQVTPSANLWPQTCVTIMIKMQRKEGEGRAMEP